MIAMIIIMTPNATNKDAVKFFQDEVQFYPDIHLTKMKDNHLVLFDLSIDGSFQNISPHYLSKELVASGLPEDVTHIYLIASNLSIKDSVNLFAQKMVNYMSENYQRGIVVHVPTNINYYATIVTPPSSTETEWTIYGLTKEIVPRQENQLDSLLKSYPNVLLWKGDDICQWLKHSKQREFAQI